MTALDVAVARAIRSGMREQRRADIDRMLDTPGLSTKQAWALVVPQVRR